MKPELVPGAVGAYYCTICGAALSKDDEYCSSCEEEIDWNEE